jgi:ABC-type branched-subunit amino acid transport system substrate-binding protein
MRLWTRRLVVCAAALALVASACGDDDDDDDGGTTDTSAAAGETTTTAAGGATDTTAAGGATDTTAAGGQAEDGEEPWVGLDFDEATNEASDIGITETEITLGNVATLTGPVPGLFAGSPAGTEAFFEYVNSLGGVYGRTLKLEVGDDALDCNRNQSAHEELQESVFAFVGSFSVYDNCGANVLSADPELPDVHYQLSTEANEVTNSFSPQPQPPGFRTGPYQYYKEQFPDAVTKIGALWADNSATTFANQKAAMESLGFEIIFDRSISPTETDFTADIVRMRDAGVRYLDLRNTDKSKIAPILSAAYQQGFELDVIVTNAAYDPGFFDLLPEPEAANGVVMDQQYAMFLGEDAEEVPEVALFLDWMEQTNPDVTVDLFAAYSWAAARLFVEALVEAGQNPTRADLIAALEGIHEFDGNGMVAPADPGAHEPPECWMLVTLQDGEFVRTLPEGSGFSCDYTGYFKVS